MSTTELLLILILAMMGFGMGAVVVVLLKTRVTYRAIRHGLLVFLASPEPGKPSPFALLVESMALTAGNSLKASFMGSLSGVTRQAQGIERALVNDAIQTSPLIGALAGLMPNLGKAVAKNPAMLQLLLGMAQKFGLGGATGSPGPFTPPGGPLPARGNGQNEQSSFSMPGGE
jgi:hypothetical protein